MAREVRLALIWHMHQPDYRDPGTGVHMLPWVQLHSARGYTDVAKVSEEFPHFKQTINFTPVLLNQLQELVGNPQLDYFREIALKPVDELTDPEKDFILRHGFFINWDVHVKPNQRYYQLLMKRGLDVAGIDMQYVRARFTRSDFRDLETLFYLSWCGFTLRDDPIIDLLLKREQGYTEEEKILVLDKYRDALNNVVPLHTGLYKKGIIELTSSPYYHPILPLLIDTQVRPDHCPGTPDFRHPEDAYRQIVMGLDEFEKVFGHRPVGMWPSEGSVSQDAVELIQKAGLRWIAADEALLYNRSTGTDVPKGADNRKPWLVGNPDGNPLVCCFRNRGLSDDIGFQFSHKPSADAVKEFISNLENIAKNLSMEGPPALVSLVCDGENPWEHYPDSGEGFLKGLAQALENHKLIKLSTPGEYIAEFPTQGRIEKLGAGSWIGGNFDIWIGCEEDITAWNILANTRDLLDKTLPLPEGSTEEIGTEQRRKVLEQIWVAEGSDWFWWYGEPFHSPLDYVFDIIFRRRLARAYELMDLEIPVELLVPIDPKLPIDNISVSAPLDIINPVIDGRITNFYEWSGSGHLEATRLAGLLAREKPGPITELFYGADTQRLFIRLDIDREQLQDGDVLVIRLLKPEEINVAMDLARAENANFRVYKSGPDKSHYHIETMTTAAIGEIVELAIPVAALGAEQRSIISLACFLMRGKQQIDRCPLFGTISVTVPDERMLGSLWRE